MTYGTALKHANVNVEEMDKYETYEFHGTTPKGNKFCLYKACGTFDKFALQINGEQRATRCNFRTAIRIIKTN